MAHSRSFLANQKARNAIVGAENLLNYIHKFTESVKAIDLYKSYQATSVLYWIIVYIVSTI